jgi:pyrimidine deaminase RibD-like protein
MILNDFTQPKLKFSREKLDAVLVELCGMVIEGQQDNPDFYGMVAAAVLDPQGRLVTGVNYLYGDERIHAERAAIDKYEEEYGKLPKGSIIITTLSPCCEDTHDNRYGVSCTDLLNQKHIKLAYCGYSDPSQDNTHEQFTIIITGNNKIKQLCKKLADTFLKKNLSEETNKQVLSYIKKIHPKGEFTIDHSVMNHADWELTQVPLTSLHIDSDEVSPYDQINWIDYDHVASITPQDIKNKPIVVDANGWIIDGNHRAVAARDMGMKSILAYVPIESDDETYDQHMARIKKQINEARIPYEIEEFLDSLNPDDVGVEEFGRYRVHYEGFSDDCQSSSDYRKNPEAVYDQVFQDFIAREGGVQPVDSGMVGDEDYPILYSIFKIKQQPVNEGTDFNQCYVQACKLYDKADAENLNPILLQVADYKGDGSTASTEWLKIPARLWQHYVTIVGDTVLDPTAKQFGPDKPTKYSRSQLSQDWNKQYQIKPKEVSENFADGRGPGRPGDSQRHGIPKGATMAELEKASHAKGRKGQLARWQLNMRRGKKK